MIRPHTDKLGTCRDCPGTVTRWGNHTPSCEVCGKKYPELADAKPTATTGSLCPDCGKYVEGAAACDTCARRMGRVRKMRENTRRAMGLRPATHQTFTAGEG